MMSMMNCQINRAITTAIAERVFWRSKILLIQCRLQGTETLRPVCPLTVRKTGKMHRGPK